MNKFPDAFIKSIENNLKEEAISFFESQENTSPVSLRLHPIKHQLGLFNEEEKIPWCNQGKYLRERPNFSHDPFFHAGLYYVQEAGSMLLEPLLTSILEKKRNLRVLDLCAAPGGKSTHLLSLMNGDGILISNEIIPLRNKILRQNIAKWGFSNCIVTQNKAEDFKKNAVQFDLIVVDAPCSGEGLFRKDSNAILEWSEEQVKVCSVRQSQILEDILPALKPGGYLIYSTCTYEKSENDDQIENLISRFEMEVEMPACPEGIVKTKYGWQAFPHRVRSEGFYCCLLRKPGNILEDDFQQKSISTKKEIHPELKNWLIQTDQFILSQHEDFIYANSKDVKALTDQLSNTCYIRMSGLLMGQLKGKDFIPSAELALNLQLNDNNPYVELTFQEAIKYLCGDGITTPSEHLGWHLIKYQNQNLGWAKKISSRWNNYYPKEWRIIHKPTSYQ